jgi:hypothetical protein
MANRMRKRAQIRTLAVECSDHLEKLQYVGNNVIE